MQNQSIPPEEGDQKQTMDNETSENTDYEAESEQAADALDRVVAEAAEFKNLALRAQAELENYRKRASRELQDERRYASMQLMRDLLPVLDNLERAIRSAEQNADSAGLLEGVKMVSGQFHSVLEKNNCVAIASLHEPFDPNLHEAIQQLPSDEHPPNTVIDVAQQGYQLHERVVRPSQVIVSKESTSE